MSQRQFLMSVKVVVRNAEGRCLLIRRSQESKNNAGLWDLPGGKVDPGETFDEALVREVEEETGLTISLVRVAGAAESRLPDRSVAYLIMEAHLEAGDVQLSSEHDRFEWFALADLATLDVCEQFRVFCADYAFRASPKDGP